MTTPPSAGPAESAGSLPPILGPVGCANDESPGLIFPQAAFGRLDARSRLLGSQLPDAFSPVGFLSFGGPRGVPGACWELPLVQQMALNGAEARNASSKCDVTTLRGLSSGSNKPWQLGSLHIEGCRRSTSKTSVLDTDQTICEIGSRILPDEKRLLDGRFILESNIDRIEQARDGFNDQILRQAVSATQHPFGFQENQLAYENAASCHDFTLY